MADEKTTAGVDTAAMADILAHAAASKLAIDVKVLDLRGVVSYTDFFVVCSARNARQTRSVMEKVIEVMQEHGFHRPRRRETDPDGTWLLLDYADVVMHIFTEEGRAFYRLDSLWGQVPQYAVDGDPTTADATDSVV